MRSNWSRVAVLAVVGCMSVVACGDDDDSTSNTGGTSGSKNDAGEGGSSSAGKSGGTGGKTGGTAGTAGKTGTAGKSAGGEGGSGMVPVGGNEPGGGTGADGGVGGVGGVDMGGAGGDAPVPQPYCAPNSDFGSGGEGGGFGASCDVQESYGNICTPYSGVLRGQSGDNLAYYGELESGGNIDELRLELYPNLGPFGATLKTGTFQLTGDDLNYGTCGVCVLMYENVEGATARGTYFATGGTVKITQLEPRLIATLTNITLEHVTVDDVTFESTPVGDTCDTKFTKVEIDAPVPAK